MYSDILSGILSGILFGNLSGMCEVQGHSKATPQVPDLPTSKVAHCDLDLAVALRQCPLTSRVGSESAGGRRERRRKKEKQKHEGGSDSDKI